MNTQVNWKKIRNEFQRLADVEQLKGEVARIGTEIRNFDYHSVLSPNAQTKVKKFEKRYTDLMRTLHQAQRQMDREFSKLLRQIKVQRSDVNRVVAQQKGKLEKTAMVLKKRFTKKAAGKAAPARKAKASPPKRRKA
jgi:hypothetical protein